MAKARSAHTSGMLLSFLPRATYWLMRRITEPSQDGTTLRLPGLIAVLLCFGLFASSAGATTWTVSDTTDSPSDSNSVRYAINHAKSGDTVTFANSLDGQVIALTGGTLSISTNIAIQGPGANLLTISGSNSATVFSINSSAVAISGLTIANGRAATNGAGGGVLISGGAVIFTACVFSTNSATNGGAIDNAGNLTVNNSTFTGNSASTLGGGIQNSGALTVTNSTFSGNSAGASGGGIDNNSGTIVLNNTTVSGNSAGTSGSGIFNNLSDSPAPTITAINTIVAGNTTGGVLGSDDCDNCGAQSSSNLIGGAPQLGALGWNGGPTQTMIPMPGSPVIGAGSYQIGELAADQRGFNRPSSANAQIDLGAIQTRYLTVTTLSDSTSGSCGSTCTLRAALTTVATGGSADIVFKAGLVNSTSSGTIMLIGQLPAISGHLNLSGPGANELTIAGENATVLSGSMLTVNAGADAVFSGVTINPSGGEAVNQSQGIVNSGTLSLSNSTVSGANATGIVNSGTLIVSDSSLSSGSSAVSNSGTALVTDSTISGSQSFGNGGGIQNTGTLVMNSDSLSNNYAEGAGGAIYNDGTSTVLNSTFSGNFSDTNGGAISNNNVLTVINSSFYANLVRNTGSGSGFGFGGGAIYNGSTLNVTSSTFSSNSSQVSTSAGGVANFGSTLTMTNSVLVNDSGGDCNGDGCPQNGINGNVVGVSNISLSTLGSHGGTTATMIPAPGSAAICAGSPALLPGSLINDQRGFPRLNTTYTGYSSSPCLDAGAVQTHYTSVNFVQQPTNSAAGEAITPAPSLQVLETNPDLPAPNNTDAVNDIPVTVTFHGTGALEGTTTQISSGGVATFGNLIVNQAGTGDTLSTSLLIVPEDTLTATSSPFNVTTVAGNPATHFAITGPGNVTAGIPFSITVTAQDANNQTATGYSGTVHFTGSDPAAILPANASVSSGVGTFTVTLLTAVNQTITVTDTMHATITGTTPIGVAAGPAARFVVSAPPTAVTGTPINLTVTAYDINGNVTSGYSGTVHFTSTDAASTLPADSTLFQSSGSFVATLITLGTQTITATDTQNASLTGVSGGIVVDAPFNLVVTTAADDAGNAANCTIQSKPGIGTDKACSLRDAITYVNNASGGVITFDSKIFASSNSAAQNTISLTAPLTVSQGMTIQGPGANVVTVSGAGVVGILIVSGPGSVILSGLAIANGSAGSGGGIDNEGTLTISNCIFTGNNASGQYKPNGSPIFADGGAIYNGGTLTVNSSAFTGNGAFGNSDAEDTLSGSGGAIFNNGTVILNNSTFFGNMASPPGDGGTALAGDGGALHNLCGTITINNSTISGNTAQGQGGGIYNNQGFYYSCPARLTMTNTIVAGNTAPAAGDDCDGCGTQSMYNLISTPNNVINAPLESIGNFGGPTPTMLPLPGGAAICAGSPALIPVGITTDQRGFPRLNTTYTGFSGSHPCVDLGAVQTNFQSVQFTNAGSGYNAVTNQPTGPSPTPIVSVTESGQNTGGVPVTLTFAGTGAATGLGPVTTVSGIGASFSSLSVSAPGTDTLSATIQVAPAYSIATDPDAMLTVSANPVSAPVLQMAFGAASIPFRGATTLTFTLNNPNASVALTTTAFSDTLPAGLVVTTPNSLSNSCGGTATATAGSSSITLTAGTIPKASSCVLSVSVTGIAAGSVVDTSSQVITAQARGNSASASITVAALPVTHLEVSAPATATVGTPVSFTVQALDASNAPVTNYSTTLHFTSNDTAATLPADSPLTNGTGTYTATLRTTGSQTITATDTINNTLIGVSSGIVVSAASTPNLVVTTSSDDAGNKANCTPQANPDKGTDAACSLRDALLYAANDVAGKITFDATLFAAAKTILLGSAGTFTIPGNTSIIGRTSGSGSQLTNLVTVSGGGGANSQESIFTVSGGNTSITSLIITNGGSGGLITNDGSLTINASTLSNNKSEQGSAINNSGNLTVNSSTLSGNSSGSASILFNVVTVSLNNSTVFGNTAPNGQPVIFNYGGELDVNGSTFTSNSGDETIANYGTLEVFNSILTGDTGAECMIYPGGNGNCPANGVLGNIVGIAANLSALGNYGGPTQTMIPLPGSVAICAINPSSAAGTDQRGLPRTTVYGSNTCQDAGAVQTNYSMAFVQQPSAVTENKSMSPAPTVQLDESGNGFTGGSVTIPLSLTGNGKLSGGSAATSPSNGIATYSALSVSATGTGDTLTANLTLNGSIAISSPPGNAFNVSPAQSSQTISFTLASPVNYGVAPIVLSATATSGLPVSFSVVSGPGTISGNTMVVGGAGTIIVAANQAGNTTYPPALQVTQTLIVNRPALTITANNATRVYGTPNPAFSGKVTGAQDGDTFIETFSTTATITSNAGTYPIVPSVTGTNLSDYAAAITNGALNITQASSTTALKVSSTSTTPGQSVTLTAQVSSATSGTPTGTISFYDGTSLLNTATLSAGTASYATISLAAGTTHTLTAAYSGDTNFAGSNASAGTTVTVAPLGFSLTISGPTTLTVTPGSSVSYPFNLDPLYGSYAGPVNFSISGLPPRATATFSPATVAANAGKQTVTLTIQAPASAAIQPAPALGRKLPPITLALLFLPFFAAGGMRKSRRRMNQMLRLLSLALICVPVAAVLTGCGGHSRGSSPPPETYTLKVTATSGNIQQSATITLDVQ
ncbi:beta strand repeat-containing protein [Acidicapsa ligni]|uniref:beta strand repeat-containing protein n=1 Tax=Acidicapsa ligni TaxID=542300 RepID=UPI0021E0E4B9|nr:choice-of-anchor Q domain-containing protein [Acidicapsa ligni]